MASNHSKILTWNVGVFQPLTYLRVLGKYFKKCFIEHEFFHKQNGGFISKYLEEKDLDLIILQEIYSFDDIKSIPALEKYPRIRFLKTWGDNNICIASKDNFYIKSTGTIFNIIEYKNFNIIPLHLNSFSSKKRFDEIKILCEVIKNIPNKKPIIVIGDTNLWERKKRFLFSFDKKSYSLLTNLLDEAGAHITSTHRFGASIDKIFCSREIKIDQITCDKKSKHFMDHYPVFLEVSI